MAITKAKKQETVKELKDKVEKQQSLVFVDFTGTKVKDLSAIRLKMRENDAELKVAKKTLFKIALEGKGMNWPSNLQGEVAAGFSYKDQVFPFKLLSDFAKETGTVRILGGFIGNTFYEEERAKEIAELPSREQLLVNVVGSVGAPVYGLMNALQWNLRSLVYALSSIKK